MIRMADFDLEAALSSMPEAHLHCRDYGHSWRAHTARYLSAERCYEQTLLCTRCRTTRERLLTLSGAVVRSGYHYAESYLLKGAGRLVGVDKDAVRLASVQAIVAKPRKGAA